MNTIEIKTDLSGEKLQVLMWELEAFCEGKQLSKPVLRQADVSGELPISCVNDFEKPEYCSQRNNHLCQKCKDW